VRLVVVRHAEPRPASTLAEDGLTERGRAQALALGAPLRALGADRLLVSPTPRATETATLAGLPFEVNAAFEKFRCGGGEVGERRAVEVPLWAPHHRATPDGESLGEFHERVASGFLELIEGSPDGTAVVIAHGGIIQVAARLAWGLGPSDPWLADIATPPASITEFTFRPHPSGQREARLVRLGDCSHLAALDAVEG